MFNFHHLSNWQKFLNSENFPVYATRMVYMYVRMKTVFPLYDLFRCFMVDVDYMYITEDYAD